MVTRADLVRATRSWINVPFRDKGRNRNGVDCIGLIVCATAQAGVPVPDAPENYSRHAHGFKLAIAAGQRGRWIPLRQAQPGDVLLFEADGAECHCGILTGHGYFVHAFGRTSYMRVTESPLEGEWNTKLRKALVIPGLED